MKDRWRRIEAWLDVHSPEARRDLCPPAALEAIEAVEKALEVSLPDDYRE
jgi:cell wall assembly regulator SMI1